MVGETGFEPATSASQTQRSTKLSYSPTICLLSESDGGQKLYEESLCDKIKVIYFVMFLSRLLRDKVCGLVLYDLMQIEIEYCEK